MAHSILDRWRQEQLAQGYSPRTVQARLDVVQAICRHTNVEPLGITRSHVLAYLSRREYATWTRLKYLEHLTAFARWSGIDDPTEGLRRPPTPRAVPRPISEAQLRRLLLAAKPGRERAWIVLGAFCGLRSFETAKVRAEDLEEVPGGHVLRVVGKGDQLALIPAPQVVVDELTAAAAKVGGRGRLWPGANALAVQRAVKRVGARAGVSVTSHQLRHRYGTAVYAESRDLLKTKRVMRHSSARTTEGYALVVDDGLQDLVSRLPGATRENTTDTKGATRWAADRPWS